MLFVGVHNAWDTVTYIVAARRERAGGAPPAVSSGDGD